MQIPQRKKQQLISFLGSLPEASAVKLFSALETDRLRGGRDLPHDELLNALRSRLVGGGAVMPARPIDSRRLFFSPFEDFFVSHRIGAKKIGQISRTSLAPIWRLMMQDPATSDAALAAASLDDALSQDADTDELEAALFAAAREGLNQLCETDKSALENKIADAFGDASASDDLRELAGMVRGTPFFKQLKASIPTSSPSLTEDQLYQLRKFFLDAHDQSPVLGGYVLLALKGRLEHPWRALGVYYHLAQGADDALREAREAVTMLPDSLFEDLETMARSLERAGASTFDAETASIRFGYFADYADGLAHQAAKVGDNVFLNRVEACREVGGEALERFAEQALATIRAAMPMRDGAGSSRLMARRPDFTKSVSADEVNDAAHAARLIAGGGAFAARMNSDNSIAAAIAEDAVASVTAYAKDVIVEIRAAEGDERKSARRLLEQVLTFAAPLLDEDEIGLLADRAAAAAVAV